MTTTVGRQPWWRRMAGNWQQFLDEVAEMGVVDFDDEPDEADDQVRVRSRAATRQQLTV